MSKKLGFALGGGGSRGVAHVGFLKAMEENGIIPDFISGTSMGAIVGACYAKGMSATEIMDEVKKLKVSHVFDLALNPIGNGALLRSKKLRKKLQEYLGDITYDRLKIPFCAVSTDLVSGEPVVHKGEELVLDGVVASSSVPGVFKPVTMGDRTLIDGGITCRVPIQEVRDLGAQVIVAIDVMSKVGVNKKKYDLVGVLFRSLEIMGTKLSGKRKDKFVPDLYLMPELGDMGPHKFKEVQFAYEKGYELGLSVADKIKELIKD